MTGKRVAIYARYSTDLQNERSIEDQLVLCRAAAERQGFHVVETYTDAAVSGASTINRPGWLKLTRDAEAKRFDLVLAEDLDRISRDQADYHAARKRLTFLGIEIWTAHGGKLTAFEGSMRAAMAENFLENLGHKVRRGMSGTIRNGRHAGGRAYGYRARLELDAGGKPIHGLLEIMPEEAEVVRRIFQEYSEGRSAREIAHDLNRDRIPAPRGGRWSASTINGNKARGHGFLQNELYAGRLVWNRVKNVRDPSTGRRIQRANPKADFTEQEAPHLAIVSREVFAAVQEWKAQRSHGAPHVHRRPKHILSGLLKCGACGSGLSVAGRDKSGKIRLRCSAHKESNTCPDPKTFYLAAVEETVVAGLKRELQNPEVTAEYVRTYIEERNRAAREASGNRKQLERKLAKASEELERTLKLYQRGVLSEELAARELPRLQEECRDHKAKLEAEPVAANAITLHPTALARYEAQLARLQETLADGTSAADGEEPTAIRELVESVIVRRDPERLGGVAVEITGRLSALMGGAAFPHGVRAKNVGGISGAGRGI